MPLPGHAESYNPPPEYLLTEKEKVCMYLCVQYSQFASFTILFIMAMNVLHPFLIAEIC
jgi:hypothetical protein